MPDLHPTAIVSGLARTGYRAGVGAVRLLGAVIARVQDRDDGGQSSAPASPSPPPGPPPPGPPPPGPEVTAARVTPPAPKAPGKTAARAKTATKPKAAAKPKAATKAKAKPRKKAKVKGAPRSGGPQPRRAQDGVAVSGFPEPPGKDPGDISKDPSPYRALSNPVVDNPDPTEWPDPYEQREDPRDPGDPDGQPFGAEPHPASGSISTSEPHPSKDPEAGDRWEGPKRDKLDD
jgi:hypothetical protein